MRTCVVLLLLSASMASAGESCWRWVKATSNLAHGWDISQGNAEVAIEGDKFTAKLFRSDSPDTLQIELKGTIKNGRITVKETDENSDYSGSTYRGILEKKKWEEFSRTTGAESLTLSDGWGMIGLNRSISK